MSLQNLPTESPLWHISENFSQLLFWRFLVDTVLLPLRHSFMCFLHFELGWLIVAPTLDRTTQFIQLYNPQLPFPHICIDKVHWRHSSLQISAEVDVYCMCHKYTTTEPHKFSMSYTQFDPNRVVENAFTKICLQVNSLLIRTNGDGRNCICQQWHSIVSEFPVLSPSLQCFNSSTHI